jgi:hypothetical protein
MAATVAFAARHGLRVTVQSTGNMRRTVTGNGETAGSPE